ncbi:MAG: hypothetical protein K0Q73_5377 [Paenibacillus sp.]|nr:hypothetical protein [Paenibacillus sp.]
MTLIFSTMSQDELIKEFILLTNVFQNLEHLVIYNPHLTISIEKVDLDLKHIKRYLFFRHKNNNKLDLDTLIFTESDLQSRMRKYLE